MSAYSTRKKFPSHLLDCLGLYITHASMIASMTGFARREATGEWGTLVCELRSVNHRFLQTGVRLACELRRMKHRFLEPGFRLPDELRAAEGELRARLAQKVRRGKVDCTMSY